MHSALTNDRSELIKEIKSLPKNKLKEVLNFIQFTKMKDSLDDEQLYFLTKEWQKKERQIEKDKNKSLTIGDGTSKGLIEALHK